MKNLLLTGGLAALAILALSLQGCKKEERPLTFLLDKNGVCTLAAMNYTKDDILYLPYTIDVERWSPAGKEIDPLKLSLNVIVDKPIAVLPGQAAIESYSTFYTDFGPKNAGEKWVITAEIEWKKGAKQKETGWKILGGGDWDPTKEQVQ